MRGVIITIIFSCLILKDVVNVLIKHCGTRIFSLPLRGATALVLDFVQAANSITAAPDLKDVSDYTILMLSLLLVSPQFQPGNHCYHHTCVVLSLSLLFFVVVVVIIQASSVAMEYPKHLTRDVAELFWHLRVNTLTLCFRSVTTHCSTLVS